MTGGSGETSLAGSVPPSSRRGSVHVGTAGFSYPDWTVPVFGGRAPRGREALALLSRSLTLLEANVSYYRIPAPATAAAWLLTTEGQPAFRFTAKLWRGFTHGPEQATVADLKAMLAFLGALAADGRLLAALAQFPPSFRASSRAEAYVHRLAGHFAPHPLAAEFRDASWDTDDVRAGLSERGISWVVADLPAGPRSVVPRTVSTAPLAYVRLHGHAAAWSQPGAGRDQKYDYLYSPAEVSAWAERIERLREQAARTVVVANNHYSGKAVVNALELSAALLGRPVEVPAPLLLAYPRLALAAEGRP